MAAGDMLPSTSSAVVTYPLVHLETNMSINTDDLLGGNRIMLHVPVSTADRHPDVRHSIEPSDVRPPLSVCICGWPEATVVIREICQWMNIAKEHDYIHYNMWDETTHKAVETWEWVDMWFHPHFVGHVIT